MHQTKSLHIIFVMSVLMLLFSDTFVYANTLDFTGKSQKPQITGTEPVEMQVNITSGSKQWAEIDGNEVSVIVSASASGLGIGQGTLESVTIVGTTYPSYQDEAEDIGTHTTDGGWTKGTTTITTSIIDYLPGDGEKTKFAWSAGGYIKITPYIWQESIAIGGGIRWPLQVQGTFTTTGTWKTHTDRSITRHAAEGIKGNHIINMTYYCASCKAKGDTKESIGGAAAHNIVPCPRSECPVVIASAIHMSL